MQISVPPLTYIISPFPIPTLTHITPMSHFYTPWKRQKTSGFLTFSGGIEMEVSWRFQEVYKWNIGVKCVNGNNINKQPIELTLD